MVTGEGKFSMIANGIVIDRIIPTEKMNFLFSEIIISYLISPVTLFQYPTITNAMLIIVKLFKLENLNQTSP